MTHGEIDGLKLLDVIKADPNLKEIVVAMVTASGETFDYTDSLKRGADAYFFKPFSPRQVCAWVDDQHQRSPNWHTRKLPVATGSNRCTPAHGCPR